MPERGYEVFVPPSARPIVMSELEAKLRDLRTAWPDAELLTQGECVYVYLPDFKVVADGITRTLDALLRPSAIGGDGYESRLFFSERFTSKGSNWNIFNIAGRSWHACSWQGVASSLPWREIIACHLSPLS